MKITETTTNNSFLLETASPESTTILELVLEKFEDYPFIFDPSINLVCRFWLQLTERRCEEYLNSIGIESPDYLVPPFYFHVSVRRELEKAVDEISSYLLRGNYHCPINPKDSLARRMQIVRECISGLPSTHNLFNATYLLKSSGCPQLISMVAHTLKLRGTPLTLLPKPEGLNPLIDALTFNPRIAPVLLQICPELIENTQRPSINKIKDLRIWTHPGHYAAAIRIIAEWPGRKKADPAVSNDTLTSVLGQVLEIVNGVYLYTIKTLIEYGARPDDVMIARYLSKHGIHARKPVMRLLYQHMETYDVRKDEILVRHFMSCSWCPEYPKWLPCLILDYVTESDPMLFSIGIQLPDWTNIAKKLNEKGFKPDRAFFDKHPEAYELFN